MFFQVTFPEVFRRPSRAVLKRAEPRTLLCRPWAERFNIPGFKQDSLEMRVLPNLSPSVTDKELEGSAIVIKGHSLRCGLGPSSILLPPPPLAVSPPFHGSC